MNESIIAVRYAKALLGIGLEKKSLQNLEQDMQLVYSSVKKVEELNLLLNNPVVRASRKAEAMRLIFGSHIGHDTARFIDLLITNRREALLPDVARSFLRMAREHRGVKPASLTTAAPISAPLAQSIKEVVAASYHSIIELEVKEDPLLLGGYVLQVGDDRYDASVASGLKRMKQVLTQRKIK